MNCYKSKKIFLDLETTCLEKSCSIIQLSGVIDINGSVVETFDFKMRPNNNCEISKSSLSYIKKTISEIEKYPPQHESYVRFIKLISNYVKKTESKDKLFIYGYSALNDYNFLKLWFEQQNDNINSWFWFPPIDVMSLAAEYLSRERLSVKSFNLADVCDFLSINVSYEKLHDAFYDANLTRNLYIKVMTYLNK